MQKLRLSHDKKQYYLLDIIKIFEKKNNGYFLEILERFREIFWNDFSITIFLEQSFLERFSKNFQDFKGKCKSLCLIKI